MSVKCEKVQKPERHALAVHTRTAVENLPQAIGSSYQKIGTLMGKYGEQPIDVPYVAYYNMDMQDLDVEIGFIVSRPLKGEGEVKAVIYPAGAVATCMHKEPYDIMEPTYAALSAWIKEQGLESTGVVFEYYLNDPAEVGPEEVLTRIEFVLK